QRLRIIFTEKLCSPLPSLSKQAFGFAELSRVFQNRAKRVDRRERLLADFTGGGAAPRKRLPVGRFGFREATQMEQRAGPLLVASNGQGIRWGQDPQAP